MRIVLILFFVYLLSGQTKAQVIEDCGDVNVYDASKSEDERFDNCNEKCDQCLKFNSEFGGEVIESKYSCLTCYNPSVNQLDPRTIYWKQCQKNSIVYTFSRCYQSCGNYLIVNSNDTTALKDKYCDSACDSCLALFSTSSSDYKKSLTGCLTCKPNNIFIYKYPFQTCETKEFDQIQTNACSERLNFFQNVISNNTPIVMNMTRGLYLNGTMQYISLEDSLYRGDLYIQSLLKMTLKKDTLIVSLYDQKKGGLKVDYTFPDSDVALEPYQYYKIDLESKISSFSWINYCETPFIVQFDFYNIENNFLANLTREGKTQFVKMCQLLPFGLTFTLNSSLAVNQIILSYKIRELEVENQTGAIQTVPYSVTPTSIQYRNQSRTLTFTLGYFSFTSYFQYFYTTKTVYYNFYAYSNQFYYTQYQILTVEIDLTVMSCEVKFYTTSDDLWSAKNDNFQWLQSSAIQPTTDYINDDWRSINEITQSRQRLVVMLEGKSSFDRGYIVSLKCQNVLPLMQSKNPTPIMVRHDFHFGQRVNQHLHPFPTTTNTTKTAGVTANPFNVTQINNLIITKQNATFNAIFEFKETDSQYYNNDTKKVDKVYSWTAKITFLNESFNVEPPFLISICQLAYLQSSNDTEYTPKFLEKREQGDCQLPTELEITKTSMKIGLYTVNLMPNYQADTYKNLNFTEFVRFNLTLTKKPFTSKGIINGTIDLELKNDITIMTYERNSSQQYLVLSLSEVSDLKNDNLLQFYFFSCYDQSKRFLYDAESCQTIFQETYCQDFLSSVDRAIANKCSNRQRLAGEHYPTDRKIYVTNSSDRLCQHTETNGCIMLVVVKKSNSLTTVPKFKITLTEEPYREGFITYPKSVEFKIGGELSFDEETYVVTKTLSEKIAEFFNSTYAIGVYVAIGLIVIGLGIYSFCQRNRRIKVWYEQQQKMYNKIISDHHSSMEDNSERQ